MKDFKEYPANTRKIITMFESIFINSSMKQDSFVQALGFLINKYKR